MAIVPLHDLLGWVISIRQKVLRRLHPVPAHSPAHAPVELILGLAGLGQEGLFNITTVSLMAELLALITDNQFEVIINGLPPVLIEPQIKVKELLDMVIRAVGPIGAKPVHVVQTRLLDPLVQIFTALAHAAEPTAEIFADRLDVLVLAIGPVDALASLFKEPARGYVMSEITVFSFHTDSTSEMVANSYAPCIMRVLTIGVFTNVVVQERFADVVAGGSRRRILAGVVFRLQILFNLVKIFSFVH
jgi:hypothetical protein